ncbi:PAS domain-containing sensor histidine kinase, partial [Actinoplanes couchii]|uniref:PAS domain-containing sensor histidine kinase n=1 Tax=Actinoplanes couchii TaxID=403638 RepID=UPI0019432E77
MTLTLDEVVLRDPVRSAAAGAARQAMPGRLLQIDTVARLAASLLNVPMATVTVIDDRHEFVVGSHGLPYGWAANGGLPLSSAVSTYAISRNGPASCADMLVEDSAAVRDHPLVERLALRAFATVPLCDETGQPVGALTALHTEPRQWTAKHIRTLIDIAELLRPVTGTDRLGCVVGLDSAALLDSVQEAFLAVDPRGIVVGFNAAAQRLLGHTAVQVCGRHVDDSLLPVYGGQPIGLALSRLFEAAPHRPVVRDLTMRHRDGHRLPVRVSLAVVASAGGSVACAFLTDLSRQEAAERLADRHSRFMDALLDSLSVGVVACDESGRVVLLNRALREVRGWADVRAVPVDYPASINGILRHPDLQTMQWQQTPLMRAFHGERVDAADVVTVVPGHRTRRFATTAQPILDEDGSRLGAVAVAHEVTAVRRAESFRECHRQVEHALRTAASATEAAPEILRAVTGTLGWPCAELFLVDDTTGMLHPSGHHSVTGDPGDGFFAHQPIRGQGVTGRVWQTGQPLWVADIATDLPQPTAYERERIQVCLSRGIHTILAVPVRDGGTLLGVLTCYAGTPEHHEDLLTVLLDGVAAQIGVYVALRRAEQYTRHLSRSQNDFIALVGHEVRTPLAALAGNAGLLAEDASALDPDHQHMIEVIGRSTATLQRIVDTLLDVAGIESGQTSFTVEAVDLVSIVRDAVAAAEATSTLTFSTDLPHHTVVDGDPVRLRQVLDGLLANAVTYTAAGGHVAVSVQTTGDTVQVQVADTGIGIVAAERDRVLDRFFRGENVRHQGIPGNGLGLSLASAVIRRHHGTIRIDDNQPHGVIVRL